MSLYQIENRTGRSPFAASATARLNRTAIARIEDWVQLARSARTSRKEKGGREAAFP